ncbi:hypothetical protein [Acinetobacter thermotolerans]|uniref:hypothetical protein n=1 Tax=Acinetobacter thermotolerans TaxID=3151487 RepID=UPI00325C116E
MLKMTDVLGQNLVQNFSNALSHSADLLSEQLSQEILNASDAALKDAVVAFLNRIDINEAAAALEIAPERIESLKQGIALKGEQLIADTLKIVTLGLAMETNALDQIEVSDCLQDYPM